MSDDLDALFQRHAAEEARHEAARQQAREVAKERDAAAALLSQLENAPLTALAVQLGHQPTPAEEHAFYADLLIRFCRAVRDARLADRPPDLAPRGDGARLADEVVRRAFAEDKAGIIRILDGASTAKTLGAALVCSLLDLLHLLLGTTAPTPGDWVGADANPPDERFEAVGEHLRDSPPPDSKEIITERERPEKRMSFPNDNYPLVGERCPNGPIVGRRLSAVGMALVRLGFPPDWWLPPEIARRWKTILFPLTPTADSVRQWRDTQQELARYMLGTVGEDKADEYYSALDNDLALIRGHAPEFTVTLDHTEGTAHRDQAGAGQGEGGAPDRAQQRTNQAEGGDPPDRWQPLRDFARSKLKGKERAVVEALCDANGELPIADLALKEGVNWSDAFGQFRDTQRRLNSTEKLKRLGFELIRHDNAAILRALK